MCNLCQTSEERYSRGDLKSALSAFVNNMDARPDCELPYQFAELGVALYMSKDADGWKR